VAVEGQQGAAGTAEVEVGQAAAIDGELGPGGGHLFLRSFAEMTIGKFGHLRKTIA
jgi:hypothetical protein